MAGAMTFDFVVDWEKRWVSHLKTYTTAPVPVTGFGEQDARCGCKLKGNSIGCVAIVLMQRSKTLNPEPSPGLHRLRLPAAKEQSQHSSQQWQAAESEMQSANLSDTQPAERLAYSSPLLTPAKTVSAQRPPADRQGPLLFQSSL